MTPHPNGSPGGIPLVNKNRDTLSLGGKEHENLREYVTGLAAAVRTHQRLTDGKALRVEVADDARIPLAQLILLR